MPDRDSLPDYDIHGATVRIDGIRVEFEHPIATVVPYQGRFLVLFEYMDLPEPFENRNIIACTFDGEREWQIEESPASNDHGNPFVGLAEEDIGLVGYTWRGLSVIIDTDTGDWEIYQFNK